MSRVCRHGGSLKLPKELALWVFSSTRL